MAKVVEYGTYIIDITDAMIEHRRGLSTEQLELLEQTHQRAVAFVTACLQNETTDLPTLYAFLDKEAPRLVTLINHYTEFLLKFRKLHPNYREVIKNIYQCSLAIQRELKQMKVELQEFMSKIGMEKKAKEQAKPAPRKRKIRRLKKKQPTLNVDYLEGAPVPAEPQRKPLKRLQPKSPKVLYPNLNAS